VDTDRFDSLTQLLGSLGTRRGVLSALGATLVVLRVTEAEAKPKRKKKRKPFCKGKDECVSSPARCEKRGPECFCWVKAVNGKPFCGQVANIVATCADCAEGEVCIDATTGPLCAGGNRGCSLPCPKPK
jgi:hypothetical protein